MDTLRTTAATASSEEAVPGASPGSPPRSAGRQARSLPFLAGALLASWLVPTALISAGLGFLVLPLLVLAVAAVIRVGGVLLDRLVAAALIIAGGVLVSGLLFSLWPWGIDPVPTSGVLFSVVALTAWASRRAPRLPLRFRPSDLLVVGTGYVMWHYLHKPLVGKGPGWRLEFLTTSEDRLNHFSYFVGIEHVGGYNFLHQEAAKAYMMSGEGVYPQGSHFLLAWIDSLFRSSADLGSTLDTMNRYLLYVLAAYALFGVALVWAARWIGGPRLRGWRTAAVCGTVAALVFSSNYTDLVTHGFDSTVIGLLMVALLAAFLVRPALRTPDFLVLAGAGLITVTYVYNLFGAVAGVGLAAALVVHRRRFRRSRWLVYVLAGVVTLGLAALPSVVSVLSSLDVASTSNLGGPSVAADRTILVGGLLLGLLAAAVPANRRTGTGQAQLAVVLSAGVVIGGFAWWQMHTIGQVSYYFEKLAGTGVVIALVSIGAVGPLLRTTSPARVPVLRRRIGDGVLSVVSVATALSLFAGVQWGMESFKGGPTAWHQNSLMAWSRGESWSDIGPRHGATVMGDLDGINEPMMVLYSNDDYKNLKSTWLAALLRGRGGDMRAFYETHWVNIGAELRNDTEHEAALAHVKTAAEKLGRPMTVVVVDKATGDRLRKDLAGFQPRITVVEKPGNNWVAPWKKSFPGD
ncbi:hypothetical protein [Kitasatospora sp. SUK 42]|uniref:hypothetical protein n=1 Tax=Kitasatospora sp. SUK 42 TaxID=1588882 RepID=UPI0018C9E91C|nr:hypothetical protein [Kitasatospora sp. SUK 42]MBV2154460.1 hypothetical protein [Kitasatospora sp. SUK 42]